MAELVQFFFHFYVVCGKFYAKYWSTPPLGILDPPLVRFTCDMNIQCEMFSYQGSQLTELCHGYEKFVAEVGADNVCVDLVYYSRPLKPDENTILFHLIVEVKRQIGTGT